MNKSFIFASLLAIASSTMTNAQENFNYHVDNFADIQVLRYEVPGFDNTSTISPKPLSMVVIFCGTKTANTIW